MTNYLLVSGGADSVALFHLQREKMLQFEVINFDHGIRPESYNDTKFVIDLCHKYDIKIITYSLNLSADASEVEARQARLNCLAEYHSGDVFYTGHHKNDVAETVMFNLLRGSGLDGCCSLKSRIVIKHKSAILTFERPLLDMSKDDIVQYLASINQEYVTDETNNTGLYTRNRIRNELLPLANEIMNRNVVDSIHGFSKLIQETVDSINNTECDFIDGNIIDCTKYANNPFAKHHMVTHVKTNYDTSKFTRKHWDLIHGLLEVGASSRISLPRIDMIIRKKSAKFIVRD